MTDWSRRFPEKEIHIWSVAHLSLAGLAETFHKILTPLEKEKASRYLFRANQDIYVVVHGLLRSILSFYLDMSPEAIPLYYEPRGKPFIVGNYSLYFNLSQSNELAFFAFANEPRLGVDVERVRGLPDAERIVAHFFSPNECDDYMKLMPIDRPEGFFNCWTRKEAYVKATGEGLRTPLDKFQVTLNPHHPATLLSIDGSREKATPWSLFHIRPADAYVAAVAIYGHGWAVREWHHGDALDCLAFINERLAIK